TDVTQRRAAVAEIAFQALVLGHVSQPVVVTDIAETITYWNEAAEKLFGHTAAEAMGRNATELLHPRWPAGKHDELVAALRSPASAWRGEISVSAKSGDPIVVEMSVRL